MNIKIILTTFFYNILVLGIFSALAFGFNHWWIVLFSILFISFPTTLLIRRRKCDGCGKYSEHASSAEEAIAKAKAAGWLHIPEGDLDYCPECRKKFNN